MIKKKLYFNEMYVIRGYILFGKIRGNIISTKHPVLHPKGKRVVMDPKTFKVITDEQLDTLKKFSFIS